MTVPTIGQEPWGEALNAHMVELEERIEALEARKEHVYNSYAWKYSAVAPPAAIGEVRLGNVNPAQATTISFSVTDADGADRTPVLQALSPGDQIRLSAWTDASIIHYFTLSGVPSVAAPNATIPVTWQSGTGNLPTAGQARTNVGFLVSIEV